MLIPEKYEIGLFGIFTYFLGCLLAVPFSFSSKSLIRSTTSYNNSIITEKQAYFSVSQSSILDCIVLEFLDVSSLSKYYYTN